MQARQLLLRTIADSVRLTAAVADGILVGGVRRDFASAVAAAIGRAQSGGTTLRRIERA